MDMTNVFMRTLIIALSFVVVIGFILRRIREAYPDTAFAWFRSGSEFLSHYGWAGRALWRRKWLVLVPCALLLTTRVFQAYASLLERRRVLDTHGHLAEWWMIKDYFIRTLRLRIPYILQDVIREMSSGIPGVFAAGVVLVFLVALVGIILRDRVVNDVKHYAGPGESGGAIFLRKLLGVVRVIIVPVIVAFVAAAVAGVADAAVLIGCVLMVILAVACVAFIALLGGFVLSYLKQVWAGREPDRSAALAESLCILPSLLVVRLVLAVATRLDIVAAFPVSLYTWFGAGERKGYVVAMNLGGTIARYYKYPPAVISLLTVCCAFPLLVGARSPWQAFVWNFQFLAKYLVRYLTLVATGLAALFGIMLASTILLAIVNELSYPGMVLEFVMDCVFLAALMLFFLACFKFFMDRCGGRSSKPAG